jgi:hypothetical protein
VYLSVIGSASLRMLIAPYPKRPVAVSSDEVVLVDLGIGIEDTPIHRLWLELEAMIEQSETAVGPCEQQTSRHEVVEELDPSEGI